MAGLTIGLNLLYLLPNQVGGTEYYARFLIEELQRLDQKNRYVIFCNRENWSTFQLTNPRWQKVRCPVFARWRPGRVLFEQLILPGLLRKFHIDRLHSLGYVGLLFTNCPQIVTIHDANWRDQLADFPFFSLWLQRWLIEASLAKACLILTDSNFAKQRLVFHFPQYAAKLRVLSPGLSPGWLTILNRSSRERALIKKPYLLVVSAFYPHKRIDYVLRLWSKLANRLPQYQLVVVGQNGCQASLIKYWSAHLPRVIYKAKVSATDLAALYRHAAVLLHPSIYEGFGYPVYEAAQVGLPIVVGYRDLYDSRLAPRLIELSFNNQIDIDLIVRLAKQAKRKSAPKWLSTQHRRAVAQLIRWYQELE